MDWLNDLMDALRPYLEPAKLVLASAAILGALVVSWILQALLRRFLAGASGAGRDAAPDAGTRRLARMVHWALVFAGVALALSALGLRPRTLLNEELFSVADQKVTVLSVVITIGIVLASFLLSAILQRLIRSWIHTDTPQAEANVRALSRLVHYLIVILGLAVAIETLGIPIAPLLAVGGVFVVALGFAMKELTENFVSGVILLAERAIKPGDILEVQGTVVRVSAMGIRTTMATTRDGEDLIIPNSTLVSSTVKNLTYRDSLYRVHVDVGVTYDSDVKLVLETLRRVAEEFPERSGEKPPQVYLTEFGSSSVNFVVMVWISDPWAERRAKSALHEAVWWALRDAGLVIAFPQLDVHFDRPALTALAGSR